MKKSMKALLLSLCAIVLVVASVMGTLSYLTSTDEVVNTFTVGAVTITLDETKVDVHGVALTGEQAGRGDANSYKLMPGHTYLKDPTVHVDAASESCYIFVKVVNEIAPIEAPSETGEDAYIAIAAQMSANGWTELNGEEDVYYYSANGNAVYTPATGAGADNDLEIFANFKVADTATNESLSALMGNGEGKTIVITAYAIQADGFTTAADAWAAGGFGTASNG